MPTKQLTSVCVILPTFNRATYIGECLDSLLNQSRPVDEIMVINDGSTDNTIEVVQAYIDKDPRIKLITRANAGKPSALNFALSRCTSDYVWICDDDDIAAPDGLQKLTTILDADPNIGMACGRLVSFYDDDPQRTLHDLTYVPRASEPNPKINFLEMMFTNQFAMLVRRSLYEQVGPFREDLRRSQDIDMVIRLTRHGKAIFIPDFIFYYRQHSGLRGTTADRFKAEDSSKKWQAYCEIIYGDIRKSYQLEEFCPTFALGWEPALAKRAQLLERALVYANQSIWQDAIVDLHEACGLLDAPAQPEETQLAEAVIVYDLPWEFLLTKQRVVEVLRKLYQTGGYGQAIVFALSRRLYRYSARQALKKKDLTGGLKMLGLLVKVLGVPGAMRRIAASPLG